MELTGVFEVVAEIEEIGARVGDKILVRPHHAQHPYILMRPLGHAQARWAFRTEFCRLVFTKPPLPPALALARRRGSGPPQPPRRPRHLRLVE